MYSSGLQSNTEQKEKVRHLLQKTKITDKQTAVSVIPTQTLPFDIARPGPGCGLGVDGWPPDSHGFHLQSLDFK